jgi:hypothetical protein
LQELLEIITNMTYTLTLTPYLAAMLDAACRATGLDTLRIFPAHLTRHPEQPGATHPAAVLPTQHPAATTATPVAPVAAAIPPAPVYESDEDFLAGFTLR